MKGNTHYFILTGNLFVNAGIYPIEAYCNKNLSILTPKDKDFQNYKKKAKLMKEMD